MKANELMVGDWVRGTATLDQEWYDWQFAPGECIQVRSILHTGINYESNRGTESFEDDTIRFDDIEPIPITAEILEKNGFELNWWWRLKGKDFWLSQSGDEYRAYTTNDCDKRDNFCWLQFVHELQHALRLCGIEKEITV